MTEFVDGYGRPICILNHTEKRGGEWRRGDSVQFGVIVQGNGSLKYCDQCNACGLRSSGLPYVLVQKWGLTPIWREERLRITYEPCSVNKCPNDGIDYHHFAPRNIFGVDAERWPIHPLCKEHHQEWHSRMDGYRRNAPGIVA